MLIHSHSDSVSSDVTSSDYDFSPSPRVSDYKITIISKASSMREKVEQFIYKSYKKHFSAEISNYSPIILAVQKKSDQSIVAAIGLSYADESKLFSENYLNVSVEQELMQREEVNIQRSKIIELNSFVVADHQQALKVLPTISNFIKSLDVDWTIYTLTRPMKRLFDRIGISLTFVSFAHKEKVRQCSDWGNYYSFKPAVYYSSVKDN